jgi:predicted nucleic acid-binding protein
MNFVFDTNIILYYLTKHTLAGKLEAQLNPFDATNFSIISVVTEAELKSLALQRGWGINKIENLDKFLEQFLKVPIQSKDLIQAYAEIDNYSQGKSKTHKYPKDFSSKNMGKNDLWIAATAKVTNSTILTNDNDFDHLHGVFITVFSLNKDLK